MHHSKAQMIVGGGIGLLACLGIAISFLRPNAGSLEEQAAAFLTQTREAPQQEFAEAAAKIEALEGFQRDPHFRRLPDAQRAAIEDRLKRLRAYQAFAQQVAELPAPTAVQSEEQLQALRNKVSALDPTMDGKTLSHTDAGTRYTQIAEDVKALETAVYDTRRDYLLLLDAGKDVLRNDDAPQLPMRARQVLERGQKLPDPARDAEKPVPGSPRVKYSVVFQFAGVQTALRDWAKVRDQLRPLSLTRQP